MEAQAAEIIPEPETDAQIETRSDEDDHHGRSPQGIGNGSQNGQDQKNPSFRQEKDAETEKGRSGKERPGAKGPTKERIASKAECLRPSARGIQSKQGCLPHLISASIEKRNLSGTGLPEQENCSRPPKISQSGSEKKQKHFPAAFLTSAGRRDLPHQS